MPIYLQAPEAPAGGPDGKGWNRLSLNSHGGFLAQCALRPRRWGALLESQDTRRARWGGFGPCIRRGDCEHCPLRRALNEHPTVVEVNAPRVLVRIEPLYEGDQSMLNAGPDGWRLWVATGPDDHDYRNRQPWSWEDATRVLGWDLGRPYIDEHGEGFWLERTTRVPAWGCRIKTRQWPSFTRHAFVVNKTRVALLQHWGDCQHGEELLNAVSHACPGPDGADEERVAVHGRDTRTVTPQTAGGLRIGVDVQPMTVRVVATEGVNDQQARLTLTGSGWTADRVLAAGVALRDHLRKN